MAQSPAKTVAEYVKELPPERRKVINAVRKAIKQSMPKEIKEQMQYGMIGYVVPFSVYPDGYHCARKEPEPLPFGGLAAQKNYYSLYFMCTYGGGELEQWLRDQYKKKGMKLDMGKCCIRFKALEDIPLDVIQGLLKKVTTKGYIEFYEGAIRKKS